MKYYGLFKNNKIIEANIIPIKSDGLESREITQTEFETFKQNKNLELNNQKRIVEIKTQMEDLNKDFIQYYLGATIENIEERKSKFISLHNELRELLGKQPRIYK